MRTPSRLSISLRALACLALALLLASCSREPESPLRIGTNVWIGSEPLLRRGLHFTPDAIQLLEVPLGERGCFAHFTNELASMAW